MGRGAHGSTASVLRALLAALALCFLAIAASAAELPVLTGRVVDNADLIDADTEAALVARLEGFENKSSDQIVVATVPDLDGEAIEPYANRLFRAWGLGQAGENNGILLLVSRDDRKMRIEVGYGLEGTLTDLHSKLIIENTMVPAFRAGDFSGGIWRAVEDIIMALEGNAAELEARAERNQSSDDEYTADDIITAVFVTLWISLFFGGFALSLLARLFGRKIGPGRYRWLGMDFTYGGSGSGSSSGGSWSSGSSSSSWSSGSSGGFSGGGGSSGGGGASGSW